MIAHNASTGSRCLLFSKAMDEFFLAAFAGATGLEFTRLIIPAYGKIFSMYRLMKAVPRIMLVDKHGTTKNLGFA